jgi:hypothetical protein
MPTDPIDAPARTTYVAVHNSGPRPLSAIKNVCIHSTEGDTASSAASWFANPASDGSANMVCDDAVSYRTLNDAVIPWAAPGLNEQGYHIEVAGYARWTRKEWLTHTPELKRAAYKAALRMNKYEIPCRWVGPLGLRLGRKGITTHRAVSYAWPLLARPAGFHTDPGLGFPRDVFLGYVNAYLISMRL